ncbi:extracellular solute-binding protein [Leucobacter sp. GX24907]
MFKGELRRPRARMLRTGIGAAGAVALVLGLGACSPGSSAEHQLKVFTAAPPDPAPVGVADFGPDALSDFEGWKEENDVDVRNETAPFEQVHGKLATSFASGSDVPDVFISAGWIPEFADSLQPIDDYLDPELVADLPESSFGTAQWDDETYGVLFTLSLQIMYFNEEHLAEAGFDGPPEDWDELKEYVAALNTDDHYGWVGAFGQAGGISGVATTYMAFLQQAGGEIFDENGDPAFNTPEGVEALQMLVDLQELGGDPGNVSYAGLADATEVFKAGKASIMFNWPFMWEEANDPETSAVADKIGTAVLPAGKAGTASVDGADSLSIYKESENPELAYDLIDFYLSPEQQKAQVIETGWLPIRMSVLDDPEVQEAAPQAEATLEQAKHPYSSYVVPQHEEYTHALGVEIQQALQGNKTPEQAIEDAYDAVSQIVG